MIPMQNCVFLGVDVVKNINIKVFNLMSRYVNWHETCNCKCRLDASVCNSK